jgi:2-hydroxy-6-oxonona-2,4-dienedioate hydrolase
MRPILKESPSPHLAVGEGREVVLLHGIFGSPQNWAGALRHAPSGFRFIVPDIPVFEMPLDQCTIEGLGRFVVGFLDGLGADQVILGGNSLGGHLALEVALTAPERVEALILTGSSGLFERGFDTGVPVRPGDDWLRVKTSEVFFDQAAVTDDLINSVRAVVENRGRLLRAIRTAKSAKRTHMGGRLHEIAVPTLLLWGAEDHITPTDVAHEFHAGIPHSELVFLDRCGHAPMIERPAEFAKAVGHFLHRLPEPAPTAG